LHTAIIARRRLHWARSAALTRGLQSFESISEGRNDRAIKVYDIPMVWNDPRALHDPSWRVLCGMFSFCPHAPAFAIANV
jgi:hypothetical protein